VEHATSPVEHATSPLEYATSPGEYATSPGEYATSPMEYATSPLEYATSPMEYATSPLEYGISPMEYATSPLEYATSPLAYATSPLAYATSPLAYATSPGEYATSPLEYATSPVPHATSPVTSATLPSERRRMFRHPVPPRWMRASAADLLASATQSGGPMQARHGNTQRAAEAMDSFVDRNADTLTLAAAAGGRGRLKTSIAQLNDLSTVQEATQLSARGLTARLAWERQALVSDHMDPVRRIALAEAPNVPDLKPLGRFKAKARLETLLQRAHGMAAAAAPFAAVFQEAGLPSTFMADLDAAADAVDATFSERKTFIGQSVAATKQLKETAIATRRTMGALNSLVQRDLKGNEGLVHEWNSARKIRKIAVAAVPVVAAPVPTPVEPEA
jgi:hypothetical protein